VDANHEPVVLIHGLDDPGQVWQILAPALLKSGFKVWLMHHPNDQPIVESARLFFKELKALKQRGVDRISIVAHSMGGLVSREMLTRTLQSRCSVSQSRKIRFSVPVCTQKGTAWGQIGCSPQIAWG
jgi:pimeloyl-ACP methyl ester carboxylesterase